VTELLEGYLFLTSSFVTSPHGITASRVASPHVRGHLSPWGNLAAWVRLGVGGLVVT
jgi:hypothetical protein